MSLRRVVGLAVILVGCSGQPSTDDVAEGALGAGGNAPSQTCAPLTSSELSARMDRGTELVTFVGKYTSTGKKCHAVTGCVTEDPYVEENVKLKVNAKLPAQGWGAVLETRFPEEIYFTIDPTTGRVAGQEYISSLRSMRALPSLEASATTCGFSARWKTVTAQRDVTEEATFSFEAKTPDAITRPSVSEEPPRPECDAPALDAQGVIALFAPATRLLRTGSANVEEQVSQCDAVSCKPWSSATVHLDGRPTWLPVWNEQLLENSAELDILGANRTVIRIYNNENRTPFADIPLTGGTFKTRSYMLGRSSDVVGKITATHVLIEEVAVEKSPEDSRDHVRSRRHVCIPIRER